MNSPHHNQQAHTKLYVSAARVCARVSLCLFHKDAVFGILVLSKEALPAEPHKASDECYKNIFIQKCKTRKVSKIRIVQ